MQVLNLITKKTSSVGNEGTFGKINNIHPSKMSLVILVQLSKEDYECETRWGYTVRPCLKTVTNQQ